MRLTDKDEESLFREKCFAIALQFVRQPLLSPWAAAETFSVRSMEPRIALGESYAHSEPFR